MSAYPEHEKLKAIQDESQAIGQFLDVLAHQGLFLASYTLVSEYPVPTRKSTQQILADYFEIDLVKLEKEKEKMLKKTRDAT